MTPNKLDLHYTNPKLARVYDFGNGWSPDREFYASLPSMTRQSILDLGCGTGLICNALAAKGHNVTGCDPSMTMLDVARQKSHGGAIDWVHSAAQSFASTKRFDLVIMTGHAFQVLLEDDDVQATLEVIKRHLRPNGRVVFESRNPVIDWQAKWNYEVTLKLSDFWVHEERRFVGMDRDRMSFELHFQFPDERLVSRSELRFWSRDQIEGHLRTSGLYIDKLFGDWSRQPFDQKSSEEMIFFVRHHPQRWQCDDE